MAVSINQIRQLKNYDGWKRVIWFWRTNLDLFIEQYLKVQLKDTQHVEARAFGNCETLYFVQSRGYGKTWITAICCIAMAILYPGSPIAVVSGTAEQAVLVVKKIDDYFSRLPDIARQLDWGKRNPIVVSRSKGIVRFKNGSTIESYSLGTFRGSRAKIIVIDEAPQVKKDDLEAIVKPVRNCTRPLCIQKSIKDYRSKMISITSACLKSNYFYDAFVDTLKAMAKGDTSSFAFALDYNSAARVGITQMDFFLKEKSTMPEQKFQMQYGSYFIGAQSGAIFPYELTERCRILKDVQFAQPAKSTSQYVIAVDLATSSAKHADNAVFTVIKLVARQDGYYLKKVVKIRSFHGKRLDALATQLRKQLIKFPNTIKVIFDYRGLGDAFPEFLSQPWTDKQTNKQYPPLVMDTERSIIPDAKPLLRPCAANNQINQQLVSQTTFNFERELVQIPINSRFIFNNAVVVQDDDDSSEETKKQLTMYEKAIFVEADALQIEMGNVVSKASTSGSIVYDVAKSTQHKDRWSSLAMGLWYISQLEDKRKKEIVRGSGSQCAGIVIKF